jgi:hypothetical protein
LCGEVAMSFPIIELKHLLQVAIGLHEVATKEMRDAKNTVPDYGFGDIFLG